MGKIIKVKEVEVKEVGRASKPKKECPYDDWACRVYGYCGTKKCDCRRDKLSS